MDLTIESGSKGRLNILNYLSNDQLQAFCLSDSKRGEILVGCSKGKVKIIQTKYYLES